MWKEGKCCPAALIKNILTDDHTCTICYDAMTDPVQVNCKARHTFGRACIYQWMIIREQNSCPFCRDPINKLTNRPKLKQEIDNMIIGCQYCEWSGKVTAFQNHVEYCDKKYEYFVNRLKKCIKTLIQFLNLGFMQHYKKQHKEDYQKYCKEQALIDLQTNGRDWNWWWKINPEWNEGCKECKQLHTKYWQQVHSIDTRRKKIIQCLNQEFVIEHLRQLYD